jgi:hypothetical protein
MKARELVEYIQENQLEEYEVMIQPPLDSIEDIEVEVPSPVPLEEGDVDWEEGKEELYMG